MKLWKCAALATVMTASLVCAAAADDRKEIEALYSRLRQALVTGHPEATLGMETPDFTAQGMGGKPVTGQQLVQQMKAQQAGMKIKSMQIKLESVKIHGKTADVSTAFQATSLMAEPSRTPGGKGKTHTMAMTGQISNALIKTAQGWKFKSMLQKPGKMTIDGKPFDPTKMGGPPQRR